MFSSFVALIGRLLIAALFILTGAGKLLDPTAASPQIAEAALSPNVAIGIGVAEVVLGIALALGLAMRTVALLLAVLTFVSIIYLYRPYTDPVMQQMALQNVAVIGGLLCLIAFGQMHWSYDAMRARRRVDVAGRDADIAQRDAELRNREAQLRATGNTGRSDIGTPVTDPAARRPFWRR